MKILARGLVLIGVAWRKMSRHDMEVHDGVRTADVVRENPDLPYTYRVECSKCKEEDEAQEA